MIATRQASNTIILAMLLAGFILGLSLTTLFFWGGVYPCYFYVAAGLPVAEENCRALISDPTKLLYGAGARAAGRGRGRAAAAARPRLRRRLVALADRRSGCQYGSGSAGSGGGGGGGGEHRGRGTSRRRRTGRGGAWRRGRRQRGRGQWLLLLFLLRVSRQRSAVGGTLHRCAAVDVADKVTSAGGSVTIPSRGFDLSKKKRCRQYKYVG